MWLWHRDIFDLTRTVQREHQKTKDHLEVSSMQMSGKKICHMERFSKEGRPIAPAGQRKKGLEKRAIGWPLC